MTSHDTTIALSALHHKLGQALARIAQEQTRLAHRILFIDKGATREGINALCFVGWTLQTLYYHVMRTGKLPPGTV